VVALWQLPWDEEELATVDGLPRSCCEVLVVWRMARAPVPRYGHGRAAGGEVAMSVRASCKSLFTLQGA
jgi:hypothetical protein